MRVWQHLYWTDDIWRFLEAMGYLGVWTLWDLLNVGYAGLDLITSAKSLVPHFNVNWKSLVQEKQYELDHDAVVMDVSTAVTAVEDDVTSSTAASGTLTPPVSQAQKKKKTVKSTTFTWTTWSLLCATGAHAFLRLDCTAHLPELRVFCVSDLVVHSRLVAPSDLGTCVGPIAEMAASWRRNPN